MTDLDRLKKISAAAGTGLPPPTNEERRFLLMHLESAFHQLGIWMPTDNARESYYEWRDACRYTIPPKRCESCGGSGDGLWLRDDYGRPTRRLKCTTCHGTGYRTRCPKCNGWGLYGGEQCAECEGSGCQEAVT